MNKKILIGVVVLYWVLMVQSCMHEPPETIHIVETPKTILHPSPLGDSGVITRNLFRSFWTLPSSDSDTIRVGIIPSSKKIKLSASKHFMIRIYDENQSWDVASPGGVVWEFEFDEIVRPPVLRYLVTVDEKDVVDVESLPQDPSKKWIDRGFAQTQWLGPPKMDAWKDDQKLKRFFLTLNIAETKQTALATCQRVSKEYSSNCNVITRMDLPHIGKGIFRAEHSNFEKEFEGIIEIIPTKKDFVKVFDVKSSLLSENKEALLYGPQVFVVPNLDNELSLVQSTTLDEYLKSVVPSEIYPAGPIEALKAQAVIARTYLFQSKLYYSDKPFLTCASTLCQVYLGEKTKDQNGNSEKAVDQTRNVVLKESLNGLFAETFYHGASGGKTEMKQTILGGSPKPYLAGTNDMIDSKDVDLQRNDKVEQFLHSNISTYCGNSRFAKNLNWSYHLDEKEIANVLSKVGLRGPLRNISVLRRGLSGRALEIEIFAGGQHTLVHGDLPIRTLFGALPSSLIIFEPPSSTKGIRSLTIVGRGSGHGVGLSQLGAIGRAVDGQDYKAILSAYYPGTVLTHIEP